ncbi:MAG: tetratricopeptide repeat protein [Planctomycetes bacterium]|nr:tetratricopeptide repeat protein [Planctomycetota bacterium]
MRSRSPLPPGVTAAHYERVSQRLKRLTRQIPERDDILFRLGTDLAAEQKWETAAEVFGRVQPFSQNGRNARFLYAQSVLQLDRLKESERFFHEFLGKGPGAGQKPWNAAASDADRMQAIHYLSYLLAVELRFDERRELLRELVREGNADLFDTLALHFQSLMEWNNTHGVERLERACAVSPGDWQLQTALAQYRIAQGKLDEAWQMLRNCHEQSPLDLAITAACLTCLEERDDWIEYRRLIAGLPEMNDSEPVVLLRHRGQLAARGGQYPDAIACYRRALRRDPSDVATRLGLARVWQLSEQSELRGQELAAIQSLVRIQNRLGLAASNSPTPEVLLEIVRLSAEAGLLTAATDVCRIARRHFNGAAIFDELLRELDANGGVK